MIIDLNIIMMITMMNRDFDGPSIQTGTYHSTLQFVKNFFVHLLF